MEQNRVQQKTDAPGKWNEQRGIHGLSRYTGRTNHRFPETRTSSIFTCSFKKMYVSREELGTGRSHRRPIEPASNGSLKSKNLLYDKGVFTPDFSRTITPLSMEYSTTFFFICCLVLLKIYVNFQIL